MGRVKYWALVLALSAAGAYAAAATTRPTQILMEGAADWEVARYCGNPQIQTFVPGDKFRTALSGVVVFDSRGNGYVAAGTFIAIVTKDGRADVLTGQPGFAGNTDGPPGRATFGNVIDIALVNDNLLYAVDASNFTLRKIAWKDGAWLTETAAGTPGVQGRRDGPGKQALFETTFDSLTVDETGAVYLFSGEFIRKYSDGVVTTLNDQGGQGYVNGPLRQARFYHSQGAYHGLVCDGKGNLYVADKANICIRKVDLKKGEVTTFAGRSPENPHSMPRDGKALDARFHAGGGPNTIVYDPRGNRFIVQSDDERVTRIIYQTGGTWVVHTLGANRKGTDGQMAVGPVNARPCGVGPDGTIYTQGGSSINMVRLRKAGKE